MVLSVLKTFCNKAEQAGSAPFLICECVKKVALLQENGPCLYNSFGREPMVSTILEPEHITRQVE